jgi:uncharacterized protein involved in response to NO
LKSTFNLKIWSPEGPASNSMRSSSFIPTPCLLYQIGFRLHNSFTDNLALWAALYLVQMTSCTPAVGIGAESALLIGYWLLRTKRWWNRQTKKGPAVPSLHFKILHLPCSRTPEPKEMLQGNNGG